MLFCLLGKVDHLGFVGLHLDPVFRYMYELYSIFEKNENPCRKISLKPARTLYTSFRIPPKYIRAAYKTGNINSILLTCTYCNYKDIRSLLLKLKLV